MESKKLLNIALKKIKIMRKTILIISILLNTMFTSAQENMNSNKTKLASLTSELADNLCLRIEVKNGHESVEKTVRDMLIQFKLISKDATKSDIGNFINKNFNNLRCKGDPNDMHVNEEHIYERVFDARLWKFYWDIVLDEDYKVDINKVIKHNGKEFTLQDHINYIIKNESHKFDINTLKDLRDGIEEAIEYSLEKN